MAKTHTLQVQTGTAEPKMLALHPGVPLPPFAIGVEGGWQVTGEGVLDVHAYVYFDGDAFFVQSADEASPALLNGRPVGCDWTAVLAPSTLSLGGVRLLFRASDMAEEDDVPSTLPRPRSVPPDEERTMTAMAPIARDRPFVAGAFAPRLDTESTRPEPMDLSASGATRVLPLGETPPLGGFAAIPAAEALPAVRPAAGSPSSSLGQRAGPPIEQSAASASPRLADLQASAPASSTEGVDATVVLPSPLGGSPPVVGGLAPRYGPPLRSAYGAPPSPEAWGLANEAAASLPVHPSARPPAPPSQPRPFVERAVAGWKKTPLAVKVAFWLALWLLPLLSPFLFHWGGGSLVPNHAPATGPVTAGVPAGVPSAPVTPPLPPGGPSPSLAGGTIPSVSADPEAPPIPPNADRRERLAVDLVSAGQYEQAAKIYDDLAKDRATNPSYREAARILRARSAPSPSP